MLGQRLPIQPRQRLLAGWARYGKSRQQQANGVDELECGANTIAARSVYLDEVRRPEDGGFIQPSMLSTL